MDRNEMRRYKVMLEKRLDEIGHTIALMKENNDAEQSKFSPSELSNYDNHPAELGTELYHLELNNALRVHEESILQDIRKALARIEDGTYGICRRCGTEIPAPRLEALPYARFCLDCEDDMENEPARQFTLRVDKSPSLEAPFGRKYMNRQEDDEHEGREQINDLMKYGSSDSPQDMGGYQDYEEYYTNEIDRQGVVDHMDRISNEQYKKQLPE